MTTAERQAAEDVDSTKEWEKDKDRNTQGVEDPSETNKWEKDKDKK
jgi:hypothetical protein